MCTWASTTAVTVLMVIRDPQWVYGQEQVSIPGGIEAPDPWAPPWCCAIRISREYPRTSWPEFSADRGTTGYWDRHRSWPRPVAGYWFRRWRPTSTRNCRESHCCHLVV